VTREDIARLVRERLSNLTPSQLAHQINTDKSYRAFVTPDDIVAVRDAMPLDDTAWRSFSAIADRWTTAPENEPVDPSDEEDEEDDPDAKDPIFDLAEKDRIRQQLRGYMKQHGIGVPRLMARIHGFPETTPTTQLDGLLSRGAVKNPFSSDVKTLQRFLGSQAKISDDSAENNELKKKSEPQNVDDYFVFKCQAFLTENHKPHATIIAVQVGLEQFFETKGNITTEELGRRRPLFSHEFYSPDRPDAKGYVFRPRDFGPMLLTMVNSGGLLSLVNVQSGFMYRGFASTCGSAYIVTAHSLLSVTLKLFAVIPSHDMMSNGRFPVSSLVLDHFNRPASPNACLTDIIPWFWGERTTPLDLSPNDLFLVRQAAAKYGDTLRELCDASSF